MEPSRKLANDLGDVVLPRGNDEVHYGVVSCLNVGEWRPAGHAALEAARDLAIPLPSEMIDRVKQLWVKGRSVDDDQAEMLTDLIDELEEKHLITS